MNFGRIFWGLLILFAGVILLGISLGWWGENVWQSLLLLWPVIIVLIGVRMIFGDSPLSVILLILLFGASFAFALNVNGVQDRIYGKDKITMRSDAFSAPILENVDKARIDLNIGAAQIEISGADSQKLLEGKFINNYPLTINNSKSGSTQTTSITENISSRSFRTLNKDRELQLNIKEGLPIDLLIKSGASSANLDLRNINLVNLNIDTGASKNEVRFGEKVDKIKVMVNAGASSFKFLVPKGFALSVQSDSGLSSFDFKGLSLKKEGRTYTSDDFGTNQKQIEFSIKTGVSSIELESY